MLKFLKYEFKRNWRFNSIILFSFIVLTIVSKILYYIDSSAYSLPKMITRLCISAAYFSTLFYYIKNFSKDLYSDTGYFTFSLPISGYTYFWGKIIIYFVFIVLLSPLYFFSLFWIEGLPIEFPVALLIEHIDTNVVLTGISSLLFIVFSIITIYLSITITHYLFKSKNMYFLWIFIFVIIMVVVTYFRFNIIFENNSVISALITDIVIQSFCVILFIKLGGYLLDQKLEL
ncbi:hypothetical protein [Streptobacillus moniliformis]|uniref:hypothetical protein n=1 Tax=Streptobacillus moniliformis TaxID=34105 RepID=UPI0007E41159|nr:hypothetical protein [Streptobacillus moniliformis]